MVSKFFVRVLNVLWVLILGLMALGAATRAKKAGLACPDWPLCFGELVPDFHPGVYFEFLHRAWAGSVSVIFVGCLIYILRNRAISRGVKNLMIIAALILFAQVIMGGLTVLKLVQVNVVTTHLGLATLFFGCVLWTSFVLNEQVHPIPPTPQVAPPAFCFLVKLLPFAIFAQLLLGGLVATSYAGAVCVDFPLCNGQLVPTLEGPIGLQVMHRFGAYTVLLIVLAFVVYVWRNRFENWVTKKLKSATWILLLAVLMQVSLGISNLILMIPTWLTVLHHLFGILLFGASLCFVFSTLSAYPVVRRGSRP
jgi:cytochrome c oxidase assembly protein subunit 15